MKKPEPKVIYVVCTVCDCAWEAHGPDPTLMDCIRLLKAKTYNPTVFKPWYHTFPTYGIGGTYSGTSMTTNTTDVQYRTPKDNAA